MNTKNRLESLTALILCSILGLTGCATSYDLSNIEVSVHEQGGAEFNKNRVVNRLEEVGYSREEAIARVDAMTADEIEFFSQHPDSIKRTGIIVLLSLFFSSSLTTEQRDANKAATEGAARSQEQARRNEEQQRTNRANAEEEARRNRQEIEDLRDEVTRERLLRRIEALEAEKKRSEN